MVTAGAIKRLGPYTDVTHISLALTDTLICFEMPFFAIAHMYAFSHTDYIDNNMEYVARMPMYYAIRDAFGLKDVVEDAKSTLRGEGMDYREFEPAEGILHQGSGRERRIKAGLRYADGGKKKYWLPMPADVMERDGTTSRVVDRVGSGADDEDVYAPLLEDQANEVIHDAADLRSGAQDRLLRERRGFELPFDDPDPDEEALYEQSRSYLFGDYLYPCIDASSEMARKAMWDEEERVLRDERNAFFTPLRKPGSPSLGGGPLGYGSVQKRLPLLGRDSANTYAASTSNKGTNVQNPARRGLWNETERVIDKADNLGPEAGDVQLRWTKASQGHGKPSFPVVKPNSHLVLSRSESSSSSSSHSQSSLSGKTKQRQADLPTDAVDLVVENVFVAQEESTKERRRGEPAMRGAGWRKGFTHGNFVPDDKADEDGLRKAETTGDVARHPEDFEDETVVETADEDIARAATPPPHAQVTSPHTPPHEENPWA